MSKNKTKAKPATKTEAKSAGKVATETATKAIPASTERKLTKEEMRGLKSLQAARDLYVKAANHVSEAIAALYGPGPTTEVKAGTVKASEVKLDKKAKAEVKKVAKKAAEKVVKKAEKKADKKAEKPKGKGKK